MRQLGRAWAQDNVRARGIIYYERRCFHSLFIHCFVLFVHRYFAVMHPLQKSKFWFKQHRSIIVCIVWALGAAMGSSQLYIAETITYVDNQKRPYLYCTERWSPESLET